MPPSHPGRTSFLVGIVAVVFALWLPAMPAGAADPRAESLFQEALELMKAGNFVEACPKLRASHAIEPKSGALIMLANCHEQVGKTATAWAEYREAVSLARTEGRQQNADKAEGLATAIEAKLSKLQIEVTTTTPGLTVTLDGAAVPAGTFGTAVAVDPGLHVVAATAAGHADWSTEVTVGRETDLQTVAVPALQPTEQPAPPPAKPPPQPPVSPAPAPPPPDAPPATAGVPTWAWVVGGVGIALTGAAVAFAVDQAAAADRLDEQCGDERLACPADYDFVADRDREERDFGLFVGLGLGGVVGMGAALVAIVTAPSAAEVARVRLQVVPWFSEEVAGGSVHVTF
ncbi:MAG: hypothetical protein JRI68_19165 [Deltaproteobacteria bacterium]|nr:hypothetical protein [Deltaproteobacteria bacterium]